MKTQTLVIETNIPSVDDFAVQYRQYGPLARGDGKFLFDTLMSPECYVKIREATLLGHPGVDGVADLVFETVHNQTTLSWDDNCKRFIGAMVACLAEANGLAKTGEKKSARKPFSKGEFYRVVKKDVAGSAVEEDGVSKSKNKSEVILKLGAEGGSITLFGIKNAEDEWEFTFETNQVVLFDLLLEEGRIGMGSPISRFPPVIAWSEALEFLNSRYEYWYKLWPITVHPEFKDRILVEARNRAGEKGLHDGWESL